MISSNSISILSLGFGLNLKSYMDLLLIWGVIYPQNIILPFFFAFLFHCGAFSFRSPLFLFCFLFCFFLSFQFFVEPMLLSFTLPFTPICAVGGWSDSLFLLAFYIEDQSCIQELEQNLWSITKNVGVALILKQTQFIHLTF